MSPRRRIAILKPSALGDIVHALPVLTALREQFPDAHITWVVNKAYESLLVGHPHLSETLPFDRGAFKRDPRKAVTYSLRFADELRRRRFDVVIDLQGLLRTGLMCAATGAPVRVGFANAPRGQPTLLHPPRRGARRRPHPRRGPLLARRRGARLRRTAEAIHRSASPG